MSRSSKNTTSTLELQYHYNHKLNQKADEIRTWRKNLWGEKKEKNFNRTTSNLSRKKCGAFITAVHCWHTTLMCIWCASRKWRKECHWNGNYSITELKSYAESPQFSYTPITWIRMAIMNHGTDHDPLMETQHSWKVGLRLFPGLSCVRPGLLLFRFSSFS